jgi:Mn-dependent DtxR family transcriptional regulator
MPISIDDFESEDHTTSTRSTAERIVVFLAEHRDQAFTRSEIAEGIETDPNTVGTNLSRLKKRGLVRHRGNYWALTDDSERLRGAAEVHALTEQLNALDGGIDAEAWDEAAPDEPHPSVTSDEQ